MPQNVKAAFFSLTPPIAADDGEYLRWHALDHLPEQDGLPGIRWAQRYIADETCVQARIASPCELDVGNMVNYLVGDPVQETHDDFMALGRRLADIGRYPQTCPSLQLRMPALLQWYAAPAAMISAEVVPFRPHRGVLLIVEESVEVDRVGAWMTWLHTGHVPELLGVPGVAGIWMYGSNDVWDLHPIAHGAVQHTAVVYVDGDLIETTRAVSAKIQQRWTSGIVRPLFAGPLRSMVPSDARL